MELRELSQVLNKLPQRHCGLAAVLYLAGNAGIEVQKRAVIVILPDRLVTDYVQDGNKHAAFAVPTNLTTRPAVYNSERLRVGCDEKEVDRVSRYDRCARLLMPQAHQLYHQCRYF